MTRKPYAYGVEDLENDSYFFIFSLSKNEENSKHTLFLRKPEYDQYCLLGYVPPEVTVQDGYWEVCAYCDVDIHKSIEGQQPTYAGALAFCCKEHEEKYMEQRELNRIRIQQVKAVLGSQFKPEAGVKVTTCYGLSAEINIQGKGVAYWTHKEPDTYQVTRLYQDLFKESIRG